MARATPVVDGEYLALPAGPLPVGGTAWFAWLNEATIFAYTGKHGTPDEAAALLTEALGWRLTQTDIRALTDRTEGR